MISPVKPPPFAWTAPESLDEALAVLSDVGEDGKVLAGGQSLIPLLNMRLASPEHLVDINRLGELAYVRATADGVRVGALARHTDVELDDAAYAVQPLLRRALRLVAHPVIRNRGTTAGSIAHADPSGEMTAVLALTGGTAHVASAAGPREVAASDFFVGPLESALQPGELLEAVTFPAFAPRTGSTFVEVARRHGDYAVCGLAAAVTVSDGLVTSARTAFVSVAPTPLVLDLTEPVRGATVPDADWTACAAVAAEQTEPEPDIHASADYRRHLVLVLTARALAEAAVRAGAEAA
ncbi:MAG: aerobic carbon-monoxide dehydrogenase medium subunit [Actinomycetota bacterium]|nr:aerobic carbon-monoxide dehydrogenase medium subunit [Actinomycetota bacterium]